MNNNVGVQGVVSERLYQTVLNKLKAEQMVSKAFSKMEYSF